MKAFDAEALLSAARARTGLADFGPADFMEPFQRLMAGLNAQGKISPDRWDALQERLLRLLQNRLWFAKDLAEHREIADEQLGSPVVIVSLPRTGSTKLHRWLGASGDFQTLLFWKANMFARIPGLADGGVARRIEETREYEKWMYEVSPGMLTGHPMFTEEPEEDQWLCEPTFREPMIAGLYDVPEFGAWLMQQDEQPLYEYFLSQLRYLQWQFKPDRPKPWLLKSPNHLGKEEDLCRIFEKPRFIVTHRDPVKCVPSITTTALHMRQFYQSGADARTLGPVLTAMVAHWATEHVRWREANPDIEVLDLSFDETSNGGIDTLRKVYDFLGKPLSQSAADAMLAWERDNQRGKHGANVYSLEMMGATESELRSAFAPYIERFAQFL